MTDESVFEYQTAAYYTLGCKLNFAETSSVGRSLLAYGVRTARPNETAQLCVINTCSVTELADKKCRYMIRKARREHPGAMIIVTGCYAQLSPEEVAGLEGVDLVVGSEHKLDLAQILESRRASSATASRLVMSASRDIRTFRPSSSSDQRTRHFLKVQDGCDYNCSYCTIPSARGRSRSGTIAEIVSQAQSIADAGGLELVLTGVNIGDFGRNTGERFADLLKALDRIEGLARIRLGSIEPNLLTPEIIDLVAGSDRLAPHFHIPLQSGSDSILRLMRRRYTTELFTQRIDYIRSCLPSAFIGVDVIVGTRGETPELFAECRSYLEQLDVSQLHVFSYSERRGTSALSIPYTVEVRERHRRSQELQRLSETKLRHYYEAHLGQSLRVIWEEGQTDDGLMTGYSDEYIRCARPYTPGLIGQIRHHTIEHISDEMLAVGR